MLNLAYADLKDIEEVQPLSKEDHACLIEIAGVLQSHGRLNRFGVSLLHSHFSIGAEEVLLESCDAERRVLTLRVVPRASVDKDSIVETNWRLTDGESMISCVRACSVGPNGHKSKHVQMRS